MITLSQFHEDQYTETDVLRCIKIYIPDNDTYLPIVAAMLAILGNELNYDNLDTDKVIAIAQAWRDAAVQTDWLQCTGADMWEVGDYREIAHDTIPDTWLSCDGQSLVRDDYPDLFTLIGVTYGNEDSTHFNLPDFRMRSPMGDGALLGNEELYGTFPVGFPSGDMKNLILTENLPAHSHKMLATATGSSTTHLTFGASAGNDTPSGNFGTFSEGGGLGFSVLHPVLVVKRIIKVLP